MLRHHYARHWATLGALNNSALSNLKFKLGGPLDLDHFALLGETDAGDNAVYRNPVLGNLSCVTCPMLV